jgi:parvulin-like peptidyl-prolyl isomerase
MGLARPARALVRQMILTDASEADSVRERVAAGESFESLSKELSRAPNAASGGNLGYLEEGTLPVDFDHAIFTLGEGEISEPVASPAGFHVFQVLEMIPAGPPDPEEIRAGVVREAEGRYARQFVRSCLDRLAADVGVRVYGDRLWFDYDGRYAEDRNATR